MGVREDYGLPRRPGVWLRATIAIVGTAIVLTLLWLLMPKTPVGVAIDAVLSIVLVGAAAFWALSGADTETSSGGRMDAGGGRDTTEP